MNNTTNSLHGTITFKIEDLMYHLALAREDAIRSCKSSTADDACRRAWHYSTLGAYDLAYDMGWITNAERQWFYDELDRLAPIENEPRIR